MRKLFCKLPHERGEKISVGGQIYTIGADGFVEVDEAHADRLLQNTSKWADPAVATAPFKRPVGPPQLILADASGRVLSHEETLKAQEAVADKIAKVLEPEPAPVAETKPEATQAATELPPEPSPTDWPEVSVDTPRPKLIALVSRLKSAGFAKVKGNPITLSKADLLEAVERAYDSMA